MTVLKNLTEEAKRIRSLLEELLTYSSIERWNYNDGGVLFIGGDYSWEPLNEQGRQIQAKVLEEYRRFYSILKTLLREQPRDTLDKLEESNKAIIQNIEQTEVTYSPTAQVGFEKIFQALDLQIELANRLYGISDDVVFVPDTNALLFNAELTTWRFDGISKFKIVFTPPILSELDALKVNHRAESVREKSEKVIKLIKECRRRAVAINLKLSDGVPLVKGVSEIIAVATEPDLSKSLSWLDAQNNDDRLLANVIEVMRLYPRSSVILVTRDINLQNKAEFANLPFIEPPDPV